MVSKGSYPNSEAGQWSRLLAFHIEHALTTTQCCTADEIQSHLAFFDSCVSTWLGPPPRISSRLESAFPSALTSDHTPLEISYSWKAAAGEGGAGPITVRFVTDVIPADGTQARSASLAATLQVINKLRALPSLPAGERKDIYSIGTFPELWESVTRQLAFFEGEIHPSHHRPCSQCSPSAAFVGFELDRLHGNAKLYWLLPSCQTAPALVALLDAILIICIQENHFAGLRLSTFTHHWDYIRNYLTKHSDSLQPRILSIDATKYPFPRLKVYSRFYFDDNEPFDTIKAHLTLDGAIHLSARFLDKCVELWTCLLDNYRQNASESLQQQHPKYCMIVHEISSAPVAEVADQVADSILASKLYLFCDRIPGHDAFVVRELFGRFKQPASFWQRSVLLELFSRCPVRPSLTDTPFSSEIKNGRLSAQSRYIKEVGLAARGEDIDVTAYVSPALFTM